MDYQKRIVDDEIDELLGGLPALAIEGPKAVGKTESALRRAATVYLLDDPLQRQIVEADPRRLTQGAQPILIDEWQRFTPSWDVVRRDVDSDPGPSRFILTGSATPTDAPTHSGAGRIVTVRMRPMSLAERQLTPVTVRLRDLLAGGNVPLDGRSEIRLDDYAVEIMRSGFPAIRQTSGRRLRTLLDGYLTRIVEHDVLEAGLSTRNPQGLRRWLTAYAAASSTTTTFERIRNAASPGETNKPPRSKTHPYRSTLERLWMLDEVPAWTPTRNHLRRLASSPVHQLADPALAARLLGLDETALLDGVPTGLPTVRDGTAFGALFESLVTLSVRVYSQANEARVGHLRTRGGEREIDLIIERADGRVVAIEVKLAARVDDHDVRHLHWLRSQLGDDLLDAIVVTTGSEAYRREDGIGVVPAALLTA